MKIYVAINVTSGKIHKTKGKRALIYENVCCFVPCEKLL
jgi:hypothetical protein